VDVFVDTSTLVTTVPVFPSRIETHPLAWILPTKHA